MSSPTRESQVLRAKKSPNRRRGRSNRKRQLQDAKSDGIINGVGDWQDE
jgi:hypothetical protein